MKEEHEVWLEALTTVDDAKRDFITSLMLRPDAGDRGFVCSYIVKRGFGQPFFAFLGTPNEALPPFSIKWKGDPYYFNYNQIVATGDADEG